ncbi:DUF7661 family protein [Herbaspirillum rubrisubalbicans]|uniref:DUF7661 family protein n=1 Tax=Herbaspirillum rubrisubalbicans TaxID=80842 RepID=UPI003F53D474
MPQVKEGLKRTSEDMKECQEKVKVHIFGKLIAATDSCGAWRAYYLGTDGKRRAADFVLPQEIVEDGLCGYLGL